MNKPKTVNFSFLILTLLFILSQTAFALSSTLTVQDAAKDSQLNELRTVASASLLKDEEQDRSEMIALKKLRASTAETNLTLQAANSADQAIAQAEPTPAAAPIPEPKPEIKPVVRYINANELNVREEPNADSQKVATIKRGDKVTYYETVGEWAKIITWSDRKGYILAKFLVNSEKEVDKVAEEKKTVTKTASRGTTEKTEASKPATEAQLSLAEKIVAYAKTLQGVPYKYGGYSTKGFDCSGFTKYVFAKYDIYLPRSSSEYWGFGTKVARDDLRAGDIVLFDTDGGAADVSHVGMYVGGGNFIHASTTKKKVIVMNLASYRGKYMGARRVIK